MMKSRVIWSNIVNEKLFSYQNEHFSKEETHDYLINLVIETENLLLNPILSKTYTEEYGMYAGVSRVVINKFRIYFEYVGDDVIILDINYPRENLL